MSEPKRHHYIPIFYLKRWVGADNRLCEYSRPFKEVKAKRKHPSATAYVEGLYTIPGVPPDQAQIIEKLVMGNLDNSAALALEHLLARREEAQVPENLKFAWARFLYALILRTPEHLQWASIKLEESLDEAVEAVRADYQSRREDTDPPTFEEFRVKFLANPINRSAARHLDRFTSHGRVTTHIVGMHWFTVTFQNLRYPILTSDRPIIMTNGFAKPNSHIAIPISPTQIFFAANTEETVRTVRAVPASVITHTINTRMAEQARKYVYGTDNQQLRFVAKRLGKMVQSTPLG